MRRFTSKPSLGFFVAFALVGAALAGVFGGTQRAAAPVPQTMASVSRDAAGLTTNGGPASHLTAASPFEGKPQELFLTRAHSAVFNVKSLKSIVAKKERPEREDPLAFGGGDGAAAGMPATLSQKQMVQKSTASLNTASPSADASFDGLDFANWGAGHPPDENGDVGPTYYIQTVNTSIGIYNKSTGTRVAAFTFNSFMSQGTFGNLCDTDNFGDPVVLYDSYEDRWMISDFAFKLDASGNVSPQTVYQCFAVSKTGDPVNGGWNYYSILSPGGLDDYPKFGIWPDGIYMSANMFGYSATGAYQGFHVWALNKQQMYAGAPQVSVVDFAGDTNDFTVIPANSKLAAGAPPVGSPEYFVSTEQFLNAVSIYKFQVNWDKISTSTFTGGMSEAAPNCISNSAPGNASTPQNPADVLPLRAMAAPQYTNQGGVESVWIAHTVNRGTFAIASCGGTNSNNATIRWYQANVTGGTVGGNLTQASTFDPEAANTFYRFQPSLAVDRVGDMAMTYTKSNSTTNPAVMYNGRLSGDPVNTLGTEATLLAGTGAQSGNCGGATCVRWGDYAGMELDPNGCEFWMTGEYYAANGLNDLTRIGSFHYPGCTPVGNGTLSGTVTNGATPLAGATITLGSRTTTTNGSGAYSFSVPAGTYPSLLADQPGYTEGSATSLVVPSGGTLVKNFTLSAAAQSGCVTDNTQSAFQRGVPTGCDLTGNPGVVQLASPDNTATQNSTVSPVGFGISNTVWGGQTFTPTVSGSLKRVDVELFCSACTANSPNVTLSIRATTGATPVPTGADLATATLAGFNDGGAGGLKTFTLSSPLQVTAGTRYAFIFRLVGAFANGTVAYTCSCKNGATGTDANPYASGQRVSSTNSGSTWAADTTAGGRDVNFVTYINPGFGASGTFVSSLKDANPAAGSSPHWTTLSFTATTPAGTAVKFQVAGSNSPNGPWNYIGPNGTASTYFTTTGADISEFNGDRYIRYEAFLSTTSAAVTPSLSSVQTCFQDVAPAAATTLAVSSASGTYGGTSTLSATLTSGASGVSGKTVSFTLNGSSVGGATTNASGVATLSNVSLSGINAGSYPTGVGASFAGDSSYQASSGSNSLTVSKASQTILITQHAPANALVDDQFTVAATGGGSGNAIVYGSSGGCTNTGANYTITGTGACTVTYDQAGNTNYDAAPQLTDSVNSSKGNQTIHVTIPAPASAVYGSGFSVSATGGNSGNPIVYGSSGGCTHTGANFTMTSGTTDCTVTFDQAGNANYNAATEVTEVVTAQKASQTINVTVAAPSTATYNSSFDVDANAPGGAVAFSSSGVCTNTAAHFTMTSGTGTCTVKFDQAGDTNYNAATQVTESVTATKLAQSITFATPATHTYGDIDFDPGATASSGFAVSYQASGACSIVGGIVHFTGGGSCTVKADQAGDADYSAAPQVQRTFAVNKAALSITAGNAYKQHAQSLSLGTTAFTSSGLVGSDSVAGVTLTSAGVAANASSGDYSIVPSAAVAGPGTDLAGSYTITYTNGTLHVLSIGLIGLNGVSVKTSSGKIDSFDSSLGPYSATTNHGSAAVVLSNGALWLGGVLLSGSGVSTQGAVTVTSTGHVSGNVTAGTTVTNSGTVGGTVTPSSPATAFAGPTVSACAPFSTKSGISGGTFAYSSLTGNLTVKMGIVKLASKTYCFHTIALAAGTKLSVSGPVTIHLTGRITGASGHIVNTTNNPANLHIDTSYVGLGGLTIAGGAHAYMTIVAPGTSVTIPSSTFFGTVLAGTVSLTGTGTAFHADTH